MSLLRTCTLRPHTVVAAVSTYRCNHSIPQPINMLHISRIIHQEIICAIYHYGTIKLETKERLSHLINTIVKGDTMIGIETEWNDSVMHLWYIKLDFTL